jgi:hypothetical protein
MKLGTIISALAAAAAFAAPAAAQQRAQAPRVPIPVGYYVYAETACGSADSAMFYDGRRIYWLTSNAGEQPTVETIRSVTRSGQGWEIVFDHDPSELEAEGPGSLPPGLEIHPARNGRYMIGQFAADEMKICTRSSLPAALRR